jgi:hypothetical protein
VLRPLLNIAAGWAADRMVATVDWCITAVQDARAICAEIERHRKG